jgi:hypothetical protein
MQVQSGPFSYFSGVLSELSAVKAVCEKMALLQDYFSIISEAEPSLAGRKV